jgi:hypothetical protein
VWCVFETGFCFMPEPVWTVVPLFLLPWVAGMTEACTTPSHWLRWGLMNFLLRWPKEPILPHLLSG